MLGPPTMIRASADLPSRKLSSLGMKRVALRVHRICALAAAGFIILQATTGALVAFRWELGRFIDPSGMARHSPPGDAQFSSILTSLAQATPGYRVTRVTFPVVHNGAYFAYLTDSAGRVRYASVDPGDATVLRQGDLWAFPTEAVLLLHESLAIGNTGVVVVAVIGLSIVTMIGTGLIFWWPRAGRWSRSLSVNLRLSPTLVLRQLHRSGAVVICSVAALSALTGIYLAVGLLIEGGLATAAPRTIASLPPTELIDGAIATAKAEFPDHRIRDVRLPNSSVLQVYFWAPERNPRAVHFVEVDASRSRIVTKQLAEDDSGLWVTPLPIHSGESFGLAGRILVLVGAVGLLTLSVSGVVIWAQTQPSSRKMSKP